MFNDELNFSELVIDLYELAPELWEEVIRVVVNFDSGKDDNDLQKQS